MMANYREQAITGSKWTRAHKVTVNNPYQGVSSIHFNEEEISLLSDGRVSNQAAGVLSESLLDPNAQFSLLNPETNDVVGQATYADVYAMLYSLYTALATSRDLNQG